MVVQPPGVSQLLDGGPWDGDPVHMKVVRGDHHTLLSGVPEVMELAGAHTDIEAIVRPDQVGGLAGWAHVEGVGVVTLHPHHHPDLARGIMVVLDLSGCLWPGLVVGADVTTGGQRHGVAGVLHSALVCWSAAAGYW